VANDFNTNWKPALGSLNQSIMKSFSNFQTGTRILQKALTDLVVYYQRFIGLWEKRFGGGLSGGRMPKAAPIGLQSVLVEIKKFKSNF
jgi:hypothetical protein